MNSARTSTVFRVTGLPATQPENELDTSLKDAIYSELLGEEKLGIQISTVILPSCNDEENERVALVDFRGGVPKFLSQLMVDPLGDWQIEMGEDTDINFDRHFFGFTQLYAPQPDVPISADIIAITGLDGHAYGSWRGKGNLGRMWLRDFLSKDLPHCRTMIYGYNSKLSSHGVDTIMDYGRELIEEMKKIRNTKDLIQRPIFFIAHSFGGIILAHCLVKAVQTNEDDHPMIASLHRATYGILLFATPHKGLLLNDIQKMLAERENHPRNALLQQINLKSDLLISQLVDFKNLIRDRKIVSFYETQQTRQLELDRETGHWRRTGNFVTAVDTDSALLQLPDHMEHKIPLHADHSMIVKFDSKNAVGYRSALDRLKQFEQDAPGVIAARFSPEQKRLKPSSTVPFLKDSMFVGREDIIAKLWTRHEQTNLQKHVHSRVALVGLGGVGKSQIAIEYSYQLKERFPQLWIFWIHASNTARFEEGYKMIADSIKLPRRDEPKANILQMVKNWLCEEANGPWIMILDNADDPKVFFDQNKGKLKSDVGNLAGELVPLSTFLPQAPNGSILVTSRNEDAAWRLTESYHDIVKVEPMEKSSAVLLLEKKLRGKFHENDAIELVQALDYMPLAISQAAAYINQREPRTSVARYLNHFRKSDRNRANLLNRDGGDLRRDNRASNSIITTWQISFEHIRLNRPSAAQLLSLMSFFDRQGIPESLLYSYDDNGRDGSDVDLEDKTDVGLGDGGDLEFEDDVSILKNYSLIKTDVKNRFEMHQLVQFSTRKWLEMHGELEKWEQRYIRIISRAFPAGEYENWTICQTLFPHAKVVLAYQPVKMIYLEYWNKILDNAGQYAELRGDYLTAEEMNRKALEENEKAWGSEHPKTLTSVNNLTVVLWYLGRYQAAEELNRRAVERREKVLGEEHPDTLTSVTNLASVLRKQGKYEAAEGLNRRALEGKEKVQGKEHRSTLASVNSMALVLQLQGKYEAAEEMNRRALEGREKVLGEEHPETLTSVHNLASVLQDQGKYEAAEKLNRRALEGREKVLGKEHPITLTSVANLAVVLHGQGNYEAAEGMNRRALEGGEKVLGKEHPDTLVSVVNLASLLQRQGKYEAAEEMNRRALEGWEKLLGEEHPNTLTSVNNLALVLQDQGKYEAAEGLNRRALEGWEKVLGEEHPKTLTSVNNLASVLQDQGKYEAAEMMSRRALEGKEKVQGKEHPSTLASVNSLASVLQAQGKYEAAEEMNRRALEGREKVLGKEHPDTLTNVSNMAMLLCSQGKYEAAEEMNRRALEGWENVLGVEHPNTLGSVYNLGSLFHEQKRFEDAIPHYERSCAGFQKVLGSDHPTTLLCSRNFSYLIEDMKANSQARMG